MINDKEFSIACKEVLEILKNIEEIEYEKIDKSFLNVLEDSKDDTYEFVVDNTLDFNELKITDTTNDLLAYIYRKYWANEEEKKEFDKKVLENEKKENEKQKLKSKYYEIFPESNIEKKIEDKKKELMLKENKISYNIFYRIVLFFKNIFKK